VFIVVSYDITDNKRRSRIAKALKGYGFRVQDSVFECHPDEREYEEMKKELEKLALKEDDSLRYYQLCGNCQLKVQVVGIGEVTDEEDVVVI
jgi:CRISPR-associated protein Cas2